MNVSDVKQLFQRLWNISDPPTELLEDAASSTRSQMVRLGGDPASPEFLQGIVHGIVMTMNTLGCREIPEPRIIVLLKMLEMIEQGDDIADKVDKIALSDSDIAKIQKMLSDRPENRTWTKPSWWIGRSK